MIRTRLGALLIAAALLGTAVTAPAAGARRLVSLAAIEDATMCVVCHESLAVAQSPEAFQERQVVRGLILQGDDRRQILRAMVADYGTAVLALPPAHGFNLLIYIVPPALLVAGIALLAVTIPRWRRRARERERERELGEPPGPRALDPVDAGRLDAELAEHT
jgi:cytochrome c-type biogenesis protein CcmH/NrfF